MLQWLPFLDENFLTMTIRVVVAAILSGLIGFEREIKRHPAGFRTHLLVGVGSCIMMLLSLYGFNPYLESYANVRFDPSRIPSYVISGIGFLGAGTILVRGATVRGLTTAASIWVVAGLGLITGIGMYAPAVLTTVVMLCSLNLLNRFEIGKSVEVLKLTIIAKMDEPCLNEIINEIQDYQYSVSQISVKDLGFDDEVGDYVKRYSIEVGMKKKNEKVKLLDKIIQIKGVYQIL